MNALDTFTAYSDSLAAGDMDALAATMHPDIVWHQPGANSLSGEHAGPEAVLALLGRFMELSGGTFALATTGVMVNGDVVATTVHFSAERPGSPRLEQDGIDLFRVVDGAIVEIRLFSADQGAEDVFWG